MESRAAKLWQRGMMYFQLGSMEAAQANFEAFLAREPNSGPGRLRLSLVMARRGRHQRALELATEALAIQPDQVELLVHQARCLIACGRIEQARNAALRALSLPRLGAVVVDALAVALTRLDEQALALELFDQALAMDTTQPSIHFNRALARRQFAMPEGAEQDLRACLAVQPGHAKAHWALSGLRGRDDPMHRTQLANRLQDTLSAQDRELTTLALFRELDADGDSLVAWPNLQAAIASRVPRTLGPPERWADALIATCNERFVRTMGVGRPSQAPVFIFGMPQSGVALFGNLLSRHSRVQSLGSLPVFAPLLSHRLGRDSSRPFQAADFARLGEVDAEQLGREFLESTGANRGKPILVCESRPLDFLLAGIIVRALPGARLLHVRRDPMDACVSILAQPGGESPLPVHDPAALAAAYLQYDRLMRHWHQVLPGRIMDIDYESLVAKPDMVLRVVCGFLGIRYGSSLRMGLSLHARRIGHGAAYAGMLPELRDGLRPLYRESRRA